MKYYFDGSIVTDPGSEIRIIYEPKVNDDGSIDLVEAGKENVQDYIQSHAESCDLRLIIKRYLNGDESVLNQRALAFGDTTQFPKTYAEMLQLQIDAKLAFDRLSPETKNKFNNDSNQFFAQAGTDEFYEKLGVVKEEKVESEVVKEE